jgi:hypothetical protein
MSSSTVFWLQPRKGFAWWKPESGNREQKKSGPHLDKTYVLGASAVLHFVDDDIGGGGWNDDFKKLPATSLRCLCRF